MPHLRASVLRRCALVIGLAGFAFGARAEPASVVIAFPGHGTSIDRSRVVSVVLDKGAVYLDQKMISEGSVVPVINEELKGKDLGLVCVYVRPGTKYGDVVRCVDELRKSAAATIAVSPNELPYGKDP